MTDERQLLEYLKKVTVELQDTRARLQQEQTRRSEPVAIVGIGCRLPAGVRSAEQLWELVARRGDAISSAPIDRGWEDGMGIPLDACEGGFVYDALDFDAAFFGISPLEATAMDPQQRLMLEVSWEALEDAGIDPLSLPKSGTGVYVGTSGQDYIAHTFRGAFGEHGHHFATGTGASILSGRVSYVLGLEGPALTVDTACSSSLVAIHLACQALRARECDLALAGGSVVMSTPFAFLQSAVYGLASDGRCKAFAAAADGVGFSEGAGVLVLERLSDALRCEHDVLALVRSSALSQDGASNGISAPNALSQERAIRQALREGGLQPAQVDVVEAHGTGTPLGDPIEAEALLATYGQGRRSPLRVGSLKSNIGHTQAAAGVVGVIKMVMALRHEQLPATLHVDEPSPNIDWSAGSVSLLTEPAPWPAGDEPRRAGVSSFGLSGTNAHLILEEPSPSPADLQAQEQASQGTSSPNGGPQAPLAFEEAVVRPWLLSAKSSEALGAQARRLSLHLGDEAPLVNHVSFSLACRPAFEHRAVALGAGVRDLLEGVDSLADGAPAQNVVSGQAAKSRPVAFVLSGHGSQWDGMARELFERSPVFATSLRECDSVLSPHADWSIERALAGERADADPTEVAQVTLFAVMVSLAELWRACGVRPGAVIGHSQGEVAAACVAGALSLEEAMRVLLVRSRALSKLEGAMGAVAMTAADARARVADRGDSLSIAAVNGPESVVVSGQRPDLEEFLQDCVARGVRARVIEGVTFPAHSRQVESVRAEMLDGLESIRPQASDIVFCSTVTGAPVDGASLDATYWYRNARDPVRFLEGVRALLERGYGAFVETSPHPLLTLAVEQAAQDLHADPAGEAVSARSHGRACAVGSLRRDEGGPARFLRSLGQAWAQGVAVDWRAVLRGSGAKRVRLPTYAFQRSRYWIDSPASSGSAPGESASGAPTDWRYTIRWKALAEAPAGVASGDWLIACPPDRRAWELAAQLEQALARHGARPLALEVDGATATSEQLAAEIAARGPMAGALSLLALDERSEQGSPMSHGLAGTLSLAQALLESPHETRLWLVTKRAVSVGRSDVPGSALQAMTWGLGRSFGCEEPARWGGLIDISEHPDERMIEMVCGALGDSRGESQLALRPEGAYARRLTGVSCASGWGEQPIELGGSALVTVRGGVPAGLVRWLAQAGAEHVLLVGSIDVPAAEMEALDRELAGRGASLSAVACDLAEEEQLREAIGSLSPKLPLTAVFHAAVLGRMHDEREWVRELTPARLREALREQVLGALHLDEITRAMELRAFVLFCSLTDFAISGQLGAHAAGGAFLDRLVDRRRAQGLPATSIAWGPLADRAVPTELEQRYREAGIGWMEPELALAVMAQTLARDEARAIVADVDWQRVCHVFAAAGEERLICELPAIRRLADTRVRETASGQRTVLAERMAGASSQEREQLLLDHVRGEVAALLGHPSLEAVPPHSALIELGFDSISAVDLRARLSLATGLELPATVVFDHPSAAALARYLLLGLEPERGSPEPSQRGPLVELFLQACEEGELQGVLASLAEQAMTQGLTGESGNASPPVRLASGERPPCLICLPSALALSGPHQFVRFARAFNGQRDVHALALPGFMDEEWLPSSLDAVLAAHGKAVVSVSDGAPFVLGGYSSGGLVAYALAEHLESIGAAPAGVVMLDTYPLEHVISKERLAGIARQMLARDGSYVGLTDRRLLAMASYLRLLSEWQPACLQAPRLLLRASEQAQGTSPPGSDEQWQSYDLMHVVPGDHFTMMEDHADSTAKAVSRWLERAYAQEGARA
jgi:polyketide synthase 7